MREIGVISTLLMRFSCYLLEYGSVPDGCYTSLLVLRKAGSDLLHKS